MGRRATRQTPEYKHWQLRASDYKQLEREHDAPEVREVLGHLRQVCSEMSKATDPRSTGQPYETWIDPKEVVRESNAQRWRMRECEYRAMAEQCDSPAGKKSWSTIAERCSELADYLERTRPTARPAAATQRPANPRSGPAAD